MLSVRDWLSIELQARGLWEREARSAIALIVGFQEGVLDRAISSFSHEQCVMMRDYGFAAAEKWIKLNNPQHWAKDNFA